MKNIRENIRKILNIKSIILILTLMILIIFINYNKSDAFEYANVANLLTWGQVGDTSRITFGDLAQIHSSSQEAALYCVQHNSTMKNEGKIYELSNHIKIEGNTATSSNGQTTTCNENAVLAYILGGGNDSYGYGSGAKNHTNRQLAVWNYWNTWVNASGSALGNDWTWDGNNGVTAPAIKQNADSYAQNSSTAQISSNVGENIECTDTTNLGAFNVSYTGSISSIVINDANGNSITDGISYMQNNQNIDPMSIVSGQDFYIINNSGKILKDVTINVHNTNNIITAELWLFKSSDSGWQKLIGASSSTSTNELTASVTIGVTANNTLRVVKYGIKGNEEPEKQTGVKFIIYKNNSGYLCCHESNPKATGKMTYNLSDFYWTDQKSSATIFTTTNTEDNWTGYFQITGLPSGTYYVGEVYNPNEGFEKSKICQCNVETYSGNDLVNTISLGNIQSNQNISGYREALQVVSTNLERGYTKVLRIYDSTSKINLTINKTSTTGKGLSAKFIIYSKEKDAFISEDEKDGYTTNSKKATIYKTSSSGTKVISDLEYGTYYIFEVEAPSGYSLSRQDGYKELPSNIDIEMASNQTWVYCGKTTLNSNSSTKTLDITNKTSGGGGGGSRPTYRKVEGYVWLDSPQDKNNSYNNLHDENEQLLSGITVNLVNKSGKVQDTTKTDTNGKYTFSNISSDVSDYYVQFDYSNTEYSSYVVVTPNYQTSNGSKVTSSDDNEAIATTYTGTDSANESKYGLTAYYNSSTLTAENINMGLIQLPDSGYKLTENIAYIEITMNGYTYKYTYGGQGNVVNSNVPTVNWESTQAYTRNIYPSDIIYNIENKTEALKVNVVYRIDITNTTNTYMEYVYMEKNMQITSLINTYDHDRYTLYDNNWTEKEGNASINNEYLSQLNGDGLLPNETSTAYISFKVNESAIEKILTNPAGIAEDKNNPTKVTSNAYHNYDRKETRINKTTGETYTVTRSYKTSNKPQNAQAYYLLFKLPNETRKLSGTVFEDKDEREEEVAGDGKYDSNTEGTVSNVKVDLLLTDKTTISKLYKNNDNGTTVYGENGQLPDATVSTDENGKYTFEGVVPGDYYIRFTYGDGTQKIKELDGSQVDVYSSEYKSTIVTSDVTKTAIETNYEDTKALWYIGLEGTTYSIATDNLTTRQDISDEDIDYASVNDDYKDSSIAPKMDAETAKLSVPIEYTKDQSDNGILKSDYPSEFTGMNLGIIKMPEVSLSIDKEITNVKLVLSNGQVLFDGNPLTEMNYVSNLDGTSNQAGGSGYVRVELDSNYTYGSTLYLTYGIKVTNNSDLVYLEDREDNHYGWYYKYGDSQYGNEATVTVNDVIDYLDPQLTERASDDENLTEINVSELTENDSFNKALLYLKGKEDIETEYNKIYDFKGFGTLTTSKGNNKDSSNKTLHIVASKVLSTDDDDLEFINYAQIVKGTIKDLTYNNVANISNAETLAEQIGAMEMNQDHAIITITPPTGKTNHINYTIIIIELIVLTTGIVILKKKVLK